MNQPNDTNEPSLASAGSQPVAWAVMQPDSYSVFASRMLAEKMQELCAGGEIVPLYSQPQTCPYVVGRTTLHCSLTPLTLTDEEREAIEESIQFAFPSSHPTATTLRNLLQRTK
jgi:hypothetical protein